MEKLNQITSLVIFSLIILAGAFFIPWQYVNWGQIQLKPAATITVTGQAEKQEKNQVARFTAGVSALNEDKNQAVATVNQNVREITQAVKDFGVPEENIKTQNIRINQRQEPSDQAGQWDVSNSIEIKLVDADRAGELADLLAASEATNVYGPNFSLESGDLDDSDLMASAIENAREKAQAAAESSGQKLGEIISVTEGGSSNIGIPRTLMEGLGGGGTPVEPGSTTVSQTVTVVFELK